MRVWLGLRYRQLEAKTKWAPLMLLVTTAAAWVFGLDLILVLSGFAMSGPVRNALGLLICFGVLWLVTTAPVVPALSKPKKSVFEQALDGKLGKLPDERR